MSIKLFNTLTHKKESFKPLKKGRVSMYHCGPTVYDKAHIGNLRSFITWDMLRRTFEFNSYTVTQVMNITDVDDKTIKRSQEEGILLKELTAKYTDLFIKDSTALNILSPHKLVQATAHINEMVSLIQTLLGKGFAYRGEDNSVYFKISAFKKYGTLADIRDTLPLRERASAQIADEYGKDDVRDFALWKAWSKDDGEVFWETPLGKGRPGWHIECSAMSMKYLGDSFDIHTGGRDLIFPHHENEIAQSEGATGVPLVRYWLHNEFVLVDGKKMAKSDGNIITLDDIVKKGLAPLAYRYFLLQAHYRTQVNFRWEALQAAENALNKLYERVSELADVSGKKNETYIKRFVAYINDDLDTPHALALMWDMLKDDGLSSADKKATLIAFDELFGLGIASLKKETIPQEILDIAEEREEVRKAGDWQKADKLRDRIEKAGFSVKDTSSGPSLHQRIDN